MPSHRGPLVLEQPALACQPTPVAAQASIRGNHAMTGHHDRDRVSTIGASHGAHEHPVIELRLFAQARDAAGCARDSFTATTLGELLAQASGRYGDEFTQVLTTARVWVNGDEPIAGDATLLADRDEVAVLPPVSGGAT